MADAASPSSDSSSTSRSDLASSQESVPPPVPSPVFSSNPAVFIAPLQPESPPQSTVFAHHDILVPGNQSPCHEHAASSLQPESHLQGLRDFHSGSSDPRRSPRIAPLGSSDGDRGHAEVLEHQDAQEHCLGCSAPLEDAFEEPNEQQKEEEQQQHEQDQERLRHQEQEQEQQQDQREQQPLQEEQQQQQPPQPQSRSLSRTSSLNAQAPEFRPKNSTSPAPPAITPPSSHAQVPPPLIVPPGSSPGVLPLYPPSPPVPRTGYPPPMAGPPPPPIPGSMMDPMPVLSPPPPGLSSMQLPGPPPPLPIPAQAYMTPSHPMNVPGHPHSGHMSDCVAMQSMGIDVHTTQGRDQPQDLDSGSTPAGTSKPVLTEELKTKIVRQVEFYFSDTNLPTDNYLMKFVRKDPEGFVPIPVVASFRKIKNLVKSHALVATALRSSKQLVVSEDGKKVRRLYPLPDIDLEEVQSRTVVVENLPEDHSISSMERLFGSVGNVKMVRICQPEAVNGANQASAKFIKTDMVFSNKLHALIEYDSVEQAERAVAELTDHGNWRSGLHVRLLLRRTFQNKHGHQQLNSIRARKPNEGGDGSGGEEDPVSSVNDISEKIGEEGPDGVERSEELVGHETFHNEKDGGSKRGRGWGRGRGRGRGQFHPNGGRSHPVGTPPLGNSFINNETKLPPGPRMPDGTRGFSVGRGKLLSNNPI